MKRLSLPLLFLILFSCSNPKSEWISLFNGENLEGWKSNEHENSFQVEDGTLICQGERSHLFYEGEINNANFKNFELKAEIKTTPGANSGIYFHTAYQDSAWPNKGYEVQVNNTHKGIGDYIERKKTGSLYGIRNLYMQFVEDGEWFTMHIAVKGKRVKVWVNDIQVVDYVEPENAFREGGYIGRLLSNGTFALQCHDPESKVYYKDIMVKPLPDDAQFEDEREMFSDEYDKKITQLHMKGFPIIDYHVHLKGTLTMDDVLKKTRETGINYGIAINCGLDFDINTDEKLQTYIQNNLAALPIFKAMQAEGREWVDIFSEEAIHTFDYVFTDAMTYNEPDGNRVHLWKPEEVDIPDKQAFMDMLTENIVKIVSTEPIDIYVNSTFLPQVIEKEYDELWTDERIEKVVTALAENNVALEINHRYKLPSKKIILRAKEKGVKFSFGTNNTSEKDLETLGYCLKMIEECELTNNDIFMPEL